MSNGLKFNDKTIKVDYSITINNIHHYSLIGVIIRIGGDIEGHYKYASYVNGVLHKVYNDKVVSQDLEHAKIEKHGYILIYEKVLNINSKTKTKTIHEKVNTTSKNIMYKLVDNNINFVVESTKLFFERLKGISGSVILYGTEPYHKDIFSISYPPSIEEINEIYDIILKEPDRDTIKNPLIMLMEKDLTNIKNKLKETITLVNDDIKVIELINRHLSKLN